MYNEFMNKSNLSILEYMEKLGITCITTWNQLY